MVVVAVAVTQPDRLPTRARVSRVTLVNLAGQAIQNTCKFHVYLTNNVAIVLRMNSRKNAAVDENLRESDKELVS